MIARRILGELLHYAAQPYSLNLTGPTSHTPRGCNFRGGWDRPSWEGNNICGTQILVFGLLVEDSCLCYMPLAKEGQHPVSNDGNSLPLPIWFPLLSLRLSYY